MTDCGCEKARRDLEEYLRHEVCKTRTPPTSPSTSRTARTARTRRSSARTLTEVVARACKETRSRGAARTRCSSASAPTRRDTAHSSSESARVQSFGGRALGEVTP